jgi:ribonuclease P/MRP protein subunit POP8
MALEQPRTSGSEAADAMDLDHDAATQPESSLSQRNNKSKKTYTLATATLRHPPFAYAHLSVATPTLSPSATHSADTNLDALQVRSYLTAALRQFLGDTGAAIPIDILLVQGQSVWVRVPREDLAAFAAGVTAFSGLPSSSGAAGRTMLLQLRACGDWLGSLIGREEQGELWRS